MGLACTSHNLHPVWTLQSVIQLYSRHPQLRAHWKPLALALLPACQPCQLTTQATTSLLLGSQSTPQRREHHPPQGQALLQSPLLGVLSAIDADCPPRPVDSTVPRGYSRPFLLKIPKLAPSLLQTSTCFTGSIYTRKNSLNYPLFTQTLPSLYLILPNSYARG